MKRETEKKPSGMKKIFRIACTCCPGKAKCLEYNSA